MEEWNDLLRLFGADKFTPLNEPGFRRFVRMVQSRGMKLIVYVSACFLDRTDPDLRPEWVRLPDLEIVHWHLAHCSPTSPGWRAYMLPRALRILDTYGLDGLYCDVNLRPFQVHGRGSGGGQTGVSATGDVDQAAAGVAGEVWGPKRFFHSRGMSSQMRSAGWLWRRVRMSRK